MFGHIYIKTNLPAIKNFGTLATTQYGEKIERRTSAYGESHIEKQPPKFNIGQPCRFQMKPKSIWQPATVVSKTSDRNYTVETPSGIQYTRDRVNIKPEKTYPKPQQNPTNQGSAISPDTAPETAAQSVNNNSASLVHLFQFLLYLVLLLLLSVPNVYSQSVVTFNEVAKEGNSVVVIPCNYSQVTNTPLAIIWKEVNDTGEAIIVNNKDTVNGRYSLRTTPGNADLVITKPVRSDTQKRFQCQILTKSGESINSNLSILTVYYLDEPVLSASASSVYEGKPVTLTCKPDGDPHPSITWYKDGQALSTTDSTRFTTSEGALEIHIEATNAADGGLYMCKAESDPFRGEDGKTSNQIDLKVIYLKITFESKDGAATCTAEGYPEPSSVMIYKDGKMIENGTLTTSVKIYEEICKSNITCYAENGKVNATEPLKTCKDLDAPVLSASVSSVYEGKPVTLTCSKPDGDPHPSITWYKDGQALSITDSTTFTASEDALEIHIEAATAADGGRYTCKAESDQFRGKDGKTSNQIDLKVICMCIF
ncbi:hemicentin-1-like [Anneissia japonica]|uniref:hemicentin-1-like n=1 Tax=Anneissia japonica TaxID=1529436 RepID=UPI0014258C4A|nr:hemicentin-1-like [Anneissia japonica]